MNQRKSGTFQSPFLLFAVIALAVAAIACGGSGDGEVSESEGPIVKIDDTDRIYTADDIKNATNFKLDDDYDIEGLDTPSLQSMAFTVLILTQDLSTRYASTQTTRQP